LFSFAWWLSLLVGFLSLSVEILWVRVVGFSLQTLPLAFSFVLASYLVGIAIGAAYGKRLCAHSHHLYASAAIVLALAAVGDAFTPLVIGQWLPLLGSAPLLAYGVVIVLVAAAKSVLFPIVHHLGSVGGARIGRSVSRIYFGNIIGATLGPLVTGFVALDYLSVDECFALSGVICLLLSMACVLKSGRYAYIAAPLTSAVLLVAGASQVARPGPGSLGRLTSTNPAATTHFIANRHGVIHTARFAAGDFVFGGNVYDGIASVDVDLNPNRLDRLYLLALLQPHPRRILVIGLSGGAWVRALQGFPEVELIEVVEINPGYLNLIPAYPDIAPVLADPRVRLHIDDGRRWLRRHPDERYDLIVQNTSYYWRANAGNVLSREYFAEVRRHLHAGGVVTANTTGSFDVLATVQSVFPYAYRYANFVYAAQVPLTPDFDLLARVRRPDGALFAAGLVSPASVAGELFQARLEPVADFIARRGADAQIITDDNLLSEYRHGLRIGPEWLLKLLPPPGREFQLKP
jgi:spermidine synthase